MKIRGIKNKLLHLKRLAYIFSVFAVSLWVYWHSKQTESVWFVCSACALAFIHQNSLLSRQIAVIFCTGLFIIGVVFIFSLIHSFSAMSIFFLVLIVLAFKLMDKPMSRYQCSAIIVVLMALLAYAMPFSAMALGKVITAILLGTLLTISMQLLWGWRYFETQWTMLVNKTLQSIDQLQREVFACLLDPAYPEWLYLFEARVLRQQRILQQLFVYLNQLLEQDNPMGLLTKKMIWGDLDAWYRHVLGFAALRWQVKDYSVLQLCERELKRLLAAMHAVNQSFLFSREMPFVKRQLLLDQWVAAIKQFDTIYQTVLAVTAPHPEIFLFFLSELIECQKTATVYAQRCVP